MEKYLELLFERLEDKTLKKMLVGVMNNAINELYNNQMFDKMSAEEYLSMRDADTDIRILHKSNYAKQCGKRCFVSSELRVLDKSEVIIVSKIEYDPKWKNSIGLHLQTGMEALCRNDIYKHDEGHMAKYHIYINKEALTDEAFVRILNIISGCYLKQVQVFIHPADGME